MPHNKKGYTSTKYEDKKSIPVPRLLRRGKGIPKVTLSKKAKNFIAFIIHEKAEEEFPLFTTIDVDKLEKYLPYLLKKKNFEALEIEIEPHPSVISIYMKKLAKEQGWTEKEIEDYLKNYYKAILKNEWDNSIQGYTHSPTFRQIKWPTTWKDIEGDYSNLNILKKVSL